MEHPVLAAILLAGFTPFGWFEPAAEDKVPEGARQVILIGNAGPSMFSRFARERDPATAQIDDWTVDVVGALAATLDATALYPFSKPYHPFLTWARKAGGGHVSPLGLNIHPRFGLWHAYRAALLLPVLFDLPPPRPTAHPCESCQGRPCLSACPVNAFDGTSYDVKACGHHLLSGSGETCMQGGCLARLACPVGSEYTYSIPQRQFFMQAFRKSRQRELDEPTT
jgi:epoxyqueuosine reductase QueG